MVTLNTCYTLQFYTGLEADTKPLGVPNGSMFLVMDTGKLYRFDAENQTWIDQANPTPSGGNDMFVITFADDATDKTYAEITAALEDGQIPIMVAPTDGGTGIFYYTGTSGTDSPDLYFASIPNVQADGVTRFDVTVADDDTVTLSRNVYPGE